MWLEPKFPSFCQVLKEQKIAALSGFVFVSQKNKYRYILP